MEDKEGKEKPIELTVMTRIKVCPKCRNELKAAKWSGVKIIEWKCSSPICDYVY